MSQCTWKAFGGTLCLHDLVWAGVRMQDRNFTLGLCNSLTKSSQITSHEFGHHHNLQVIGLQYIYCRLYPHSHEVVHECWAINEGISFHKEAMNSSESNWWVVFSARVERGRIGGKLGGMQLPRPRKLEHIHVFDIADKRNSIWTSFLLGIMDALGLTLRLGHSKSLL